MDAEGFVRGNVFDVGRSTLTESLVFKWYWFLSILKKFGLARGEGRWRESSLRVSEGLVKVVIVLDWFLETVRRSCVFWFRRLKLPGFLVFGIGEEEIITCSLVCREI